MPFDLPEAESELVAGFMAEYGSVLFSLIMFAEYANIISMSFILIIVFSFNFDCFLFVIFIVCLIRCSLNRYKFDELMTNC